MSEENYYVIIINYLNFTFAFTKTYGEEVVQISLCLKLSWFLILDDQILIKTLYILSNKYNVYMLGMLYYLTI